MYNNSHILNCITNKRLLYRQRIKENLFKTFYYISDIFFIVFFQRATDFSLGIIDQDSISVYDLIWAYVPSVVSKASALALLALSTFLFGYHCYSPRLLKDCIYTYKFRSKYFW